MAKHSIQSVKFLPIFIVVYFITYLDVDGHGSRQLFHKCIHSSIELNFHSSTEKIDDMRIEIKSNRSIIMVIAIYGEPHSYMYYIRSHMYYILHDYTMNASTYIYDTVKGEGSYFLEEIRVSKKVERKSDFC